MKRERHVGRKRGAGKGLWLLVTVVVLVVLLALPTVSSPRVSRLRGLRKSRSCHATYPSQHSIWG